MLWFAVLAVWCGSGCAHSALPAAPAHVKPFYPAAAHARHFTAFKATYNKQYATPEEERMRFEIFKNKLKRINELNAQYKETVYGMTKFSDLTTEEIIGRYTGLLVDKSKKPMLAPLLNLSTIEVPDSFDWRDKKVVTSVKDQEMCGSCWAFGIIGCLESQYAMKYGKLVDFSEQQLVDCDEFDHGCHGGFYENAIGYMMQKGIMKDADYPYKSYEDKCNYNAQKVAVSVKGYESYAYIDEDLLKKVLYVKGPLAISVDHSGFIFNQGGVIRDCNHTNIDHAVLLVGYGKENGVDYWLIKNSWGKDVGDKGYFKLERNVDCLGMRKGAGAEIVVLHI